MRSQSIGQPRQKRILVPGLEFFLKDDHLPPEHIAAMIRQDKSVLSLRTHYRSLLPN